VTPSPFDCWLVDRGLRTLPYRMRAHSESALALARFLESHPRVDRVYYPALESCVNHAVAMMQMPRGCSGMLLLSVKGREAAMRMIARVNIFTRASSLGGVESLIEHRASSPIQTHGQGTGLTLPQDLIRISVAAGTRGRFDRRPRPGLGGSMRRPIERQTVP
jgi:cystathionine gamma-synthase